MNETEIVSINENEKSTDCEKSLDQPTTLSLDLETEISKSMMCADDSIAHVNKLMLGLEIKASPEIKDPRQVVSVIKDLNTSADVTHTALSCSREIRNLLKAKLEAAEFIHHVRREKK